MNLDVEKIRQTKQQNKDIMVDELQKKKLLEKMTEHNLLDNIIKYVDGLEFLSDRLDYALTEVLSSVDEAEIKVNLIFDVKFDSVNHPGKIKFHFFRSEVEFLDVTLYDNITTALKIDAEQYSIEKYEIYNIFEQALIAASNDIYNKIYEDFKVYGCKGLKVKIGSTRTTSGKLSRCYAVNVTFNNPTLGGWERFARKFR